jgi:hypothetical protein
MIKIHRIALVNSLKDLRKRNLSRLHEQMDVVPQQGISIERETVAHLVIPENVEVPTIIFWVEKHTLLLVSPGDHVI